jgi:hypothetical protein
VLRRAGERFELIFSVSQGKLKSPPGTTGTTTPRNLKVFFGKSPWQPPAHLSERHAVYPAELTFRFDHPHRSPVASTPPVHSMRVFRGFVVDRSGRKRQLTFEPIIKRVPWCDARALSLFETMAI